MKKAMLAAMVFGVMVVGAYAAEGVCPASKDACNTAVKKVEMTAEELTKCIAEKEAVLAKETDATKQAALKKEIEVLKKQLEAKQPKKN